jgi:hypothetical protein
MKMIFLGPNDKNTNGGDRKHYEHYGMFIIDFAYGVFIWKRFYSLDIMHTLSENIILFVSNHGVNPPQEY